MKIIKCVFAVILGIVVLLILTVLPIIDSLNHGDALPLVTAVGVLIGIFLWAFMKNQDRKQKEEIENRKESKFWDEDI